MKQIVFSRHALEQLADRGATREEAEQAIDTGEQVPAKRGRLAFRKSFPFNSLWKGKYYPIKQVMAIVKEEESELVVITVYAFYFGGA